MATVIRRGDGATRDIPSAAQARGAPLQETPTRELLSGIMEQGRRLVQEEVRLAKAELRRDAKALGKDAGAVAGGGVVAHIGALVLAGAIVALLALVLPVWAAALITAAAFLAIGGAVAMAGMKKLKSIHGPTETITTLKEDKQWARQTARDAKSQLRAPN